MRNFFDIDDLDPDGWERLLALALDPPRPGAAGRPGRGAALPEAVGAHPQLDRDGGRRPGRAPRLHPGDRGRPRRAGDRRGRRPHPRLLPPRPVRAGVRARRAGAHGGRAGAERLRRAGGEPAVRRRAPVPGRGRRAHHARGAGPAGRPRPDLCRRRQQHGPLAGQGGAARGHGGPLRHAGRLRVLRRGAGRAAGLRRPHGAGRDRAGDRRPRPGGQGCRRPLHRRVDQHGPGGGAGDPARRLRGLHHRRRRWSSRAAADAVVLHCLPAHRGEEITDEVLEGPRSLVWRQAAHRRTAMRGILAWVVEGSR